MLGNLHRPPLTPDHPLGLPTTSTTSGSRVCCAKAASVARSSATSSVEIHNAQVMESRGSVTKIYHFLRGLLGYCNAKRSWIGTQQVAKLGGIRSETLALYLSKSEQNGPNNWMFFVYLCYTNIIVSRFETVKKE